MTTVKELIDWEVENVIDRFEVLTNDHVADNVDENIMNAVKSVYNYYTKP